MVSVEILVLEQSVVLLLAVNTYQLNQARLIRAFFITK